MAQTTNFTIDTSSLNHILESDESVRETIETMSGKPVVLSIPSDSLMEIAGGKWVYNDTKRMGVSFRLQRLVTLANVLSESGSLLLNDMPQVIIEHELKHTQTKHTSVSSVRATNVALLDTNRHQQIYDAVNDLSRARNEAKKSAMEKDKIARKTGLISSSAAEDYLKSFESTQKNLDWRDFLHHRFSQWGFGEKLSLEAFSNILDEKNCLFINSFVNFLSVHHLSIFLDPEKCDPALKILIEIEQNSLPDALLAANAAYADYFICDDEKLTARCNFLNSANGVKFKTIGIDQFRDMLKKI